MAQIGEFERPILTVDLVPLTLVAGELCLLRARRDNEPFAGKPALIGGFVHTAADASLGDAARRTLAAKAGLTGIYVEQLSTFSGPDRDPRGWSASVAYFALCRPELLEPGLARPGVELVPVAEANGMPFDHDTILAAALERLRGKGAYSDLPARLLGPEFTLAELHRTYQAVLGAELNIDAFRRKALEREFIEEAEGKRRDPGARKPAQLYRLRAGQAVFDRRI